ncbi:MAG: DUF4345 domain-containing protein [Bacteroidota bacterium]
MNWIAKHLHLLISLSIVIPTGIIYGSPSILPTQLDIQVNSIDLSNMLKATMCLYLGVSIVWFWGIWKAQYWKRATELNILFMLSLATGRALSILVDGLPSGGYIFGIIAELLEGLLSLYQLKKYKAEY